VRELYLARLMVESIVDLPKYSITSLVGSRRMQDKDLTKSFIDKLNNNDLGSVIKVISTFLSRIYGYTKDTLP